jgi:TIR domain
MEPIRCFISHSSKDQDFVDQLYADLWKRKVSCWLSTHDIRGGKKIYDQIYDGIYQSERVLLVLSEHSMKSQWVNTEIASARKREVLEKRQVLFPIRIVSFEVIRKWESFDADIGRDSAREVREYYIPDFSNWQDRTAYAKLLKRLVDDLNAARPRKKRGA